jgi:O-antigen/teichoic acid export membrane protein
MLHSSFGLLVGKGTQVFAGFVFWVIAARATTTREVGLTAAAASAVMLCTQIAALGAGSAVILSLGQGRDTRTTLDTAFSLVTVAGLPMAVAYLLVAGRTDPNTASAAASPLLWPVFIIAVVAGTLIIVVDQANVALGRGASSAPRYALGGLATLSAAGLVAWQVQTPRVTLLLACWGVGSLVACAVGAVQLRRLIRYRYRPTVHLGRFRGLLGVGIPNQVLTLTERIPGLLLPVLVAHVVSPETAAYWYPAWMMVWAAYSAPVLMGIVHFSEGVRDPGRLGRTTRVSIGWSLAAGAVIGAVLAIGATPLLMLMGSEYSAQSAEALRLLALGLVGYALLQGYNAVCRAQGRYGEGIAFGAVLALGLCAVPLAVADRGVTPMAVAWLGVLTVGSAVAGVRLVALIRGGTDG